MTHPPRIANAPCSWGVIGGEGPALGYERMLDELVAAGYHGTELGDHGFMPTDPARLRDELRSRGLTLLGGFVGVELRRPGVVAEARDEVLEVARLMAATETSARRPLLILADANGRDGVRSLHAGRIEPAQALPPDELRRFARQAEEIARIVEGDTGLATAFHPHGAGWIETPDEVEALLAHTDAHLIGLVFDTAHHVYGCGVPDDGAQAASGIERFWGRIRTVHVKDCSAEVAARARRRLGLRACGARRPLLRARSGQRGLHGGAANARPPRLRRLAHGRAGRVPRHGDAVRERSAQPGATGGLGRRLTATVSRAPRAASGWSPAPRRSTGSGRASRRPAEAGRRGR
jgi:inosose dehydratase